MKLKTGVLALVVAFAIFFILTSPDVAANIARGTWDLVVRVAHGLNDFIDKLAS